MATFGFGTQQVNSAPAVPMDTDSQFQQTTMLCPSGCGRILSIAGPIKKEGSRFKGKYFTNCNGETTNLWEGLPGGCGTWCVVGEKPKRTYTKGYTAKWTLDPEKSRGDWHGAKRTDSETQKAIDRVANAVATLTQRVDAIEKRISQ